ncbi:MAG: hypothetical protein R3B54_00220 [Bdellovibrionota bacterium]
MLHDFGKVTVREETLLKADKTSPLGMVWKIEKRIEGVLYRHEIEILTHLQNLVSEKRAPTDIDLARMHKAIEAPQTACSTYSTQSEN